VIFSQRNDVINSKEIFNYSDGFLLEVLEKLINLKNTYLTNPKNSEFSNQLKSILGKSFNEEEIQNLIQNTNQEFSQKINEKFLMKRNERIKYLGKDQAYEIEKSIFLQTIDLNWKSHIQYLEHLRQVIGLRSYGQRDPLIEYKNEAFSLFENLLNKLKTDLIRILINLTIIKKEKSDQNKINKNINISNNPKCLLILKKGQKISRNEKCSATGKKYKQCCGAL